MDSKKVLCAVAATAVLAIVAVLMLQSNRHEDRARAVSSSHSGASEPDQMQAPAMPETASQISPAVKKTAAPKAPGDDVAMRFQEAKDYRVLFESLLRERTEKSGLYAMYILSLCTGMRTADFKAKPSISSQQDEAQQKMIARCNTFTEHELSGERRLELLKDPRIRGRLWELRATWSGSLTDISLLGEIFATQDPLLLEHIVPPLFFTEGGKTITFNGQRYTQPYAAEVLGLAWRAAVCEATQTPCGRGDPYVLEVCAVSGTCVDSRQAAMLHLVQEQFGQDGVALYGKVFPEFVATIRTADLSVFGKQVSASPGTK